MIKFFFISLILFSLVFSCTKKTDNYDHKPNLTKVNFEDKILTPATTDYTATNPSGAIESTLVDKVGIVEHEKRIRLNTTAPIILGVAAGNISFDHTFADGLSILSNPYSHNLNDDNELTYYEQIWVKWGINKAQGKKVQLIRVMEDYMGQLAINHERSISMKEDLGDLLASEEKKKKFANDLVDLYFASAQINDCFEENYCLIKEQEDGSGYIRIINSIIFFNAGFKSISQIIMFTMNPESDPVEDLEIAQNMQQPLTLLSSWAGIETSMNKEQVDEILHPADKVGGNQEEVYKENIWIKWTADGTIETVRIMKGYLGAFIWPGIGEVKLGQPLEEYLPDESAIVLSILKLYQDLYQKDEYYDCISEKSCLLGKDANANYILQFFKDQKISLVLFFDGFLKSVTQILIFKGEEV